MLLKTGQRSWSYFKMKLQDSQEKLQKQKQSKKLKNFLLD